MPGLRDILDEMVDAVATALAGSGLDIQVERGMVLNPSPPVIDVYVTDPAREFDFAAYGDEAGGYQVTVRARVQTADNDAGQDLLIAFMDDEDPLCIGMAFAADPSLNGNATGLAIVAASGHRAYETPDPERAHLGCQWDFLVIPRRGT